MVFVDNNSFDTQVWLLYLSAVKNIILNSKPSHSQWPIQTSLRIILMYYLQINNALASLKWTLCSCISQTSGWDQVTFTFTHSQAKLQGHWLLSLFLLYDRSLAYSMPGQTVWAQVRFELDHIHRSKLIPSQGFKSMRQTKKGNIFLSIKITKDWYEIL